MVAGVLRLPRFGQRRANGAAAGQNRDSDSKKQCPFHVRLSRGGDERKIVILVLGIV